MCCMLLLLLNSIPLISVINRYLFQGRCLAELHNRAYFLLDIVFWSHRFVRLGVCVFWHHFQFIKYIHIIILLFSHSFVSWSYQNNRWKWLLLRNPSISVSKGTRWSVFPPLALLPLLVSGGIDVVYDVRRCVSHYSTNTRSDGKECIQNISRSWYHFECNVHRRPVVTGTHLSSRPVIKLRPTFFLDTFYLCS